MAKDTFDPEDKLAAERAALRKAQVAAAMLQQMPSLSPKQSGVVYGPLSVAADLFRGYRTKRAVEGVTEEEEKLARRLQQLKREAGAKYASGDPTRESLIEAMMDPYAQDLLPLIKSDIKAQEPPKETYKVLGGKLYRAGGKNKEASVVADESEKWGEPYAGPGGTMLRKNLKSGKVEQVVGRERVGDTINVNTVDPRKVQLEGVKGVRLWLETNKDKAINVGNRREIVARARELLAEGTIKGATAPVAEFGAQIVAGFGGELPKKVKNYAEYKRVLGPLVLDEVRKLAPVTEQDRTYIESINAAEAAQSDEVLSNLLDIYERELDAFSEQYNTQADFFTEMTEDPRFRKAYPTITPREAPASAGGGTSSQKGRLRRWNPQTQAFE